ncbi:class I SAM-dependent methyltransferase [Planctobacterium marinum]|uniref:class I SAM-dependent methyltransferase n=1 Tax=Planctobacterium marinum TaxID=1631968 RepID=UPI001E5C470C|nr:class I SAM-dependent methyltransferase [Planctobacterium marinum]MCC2606140.1 class I SAM-dependent methyltransferase [Planctobacterium marinum]
MPLLFEQIKALKLPSTETWIAEAEFGFRFISDEVKTLKPGSGVLEVGCGSGLLLAQLSESFSCVEFEGIEPFSDGFSALKEFNFLVQRKGLNIHNLKYEEFESNKKFDLIYCINVFEHLNDWRDMLMWASSLLMDCGRIVVLCPNYSFPYESHVRIPIIINKKITYKVFRKTIQAFEANNRIVGLWDSLNFVKKREVKAFTKNNYQALNLKLDDDVSIIDYMIDRTLYDEEFKRRQAVIGNFALILKKSGFLYLLKRLPNLLPYMKLSFSKD